MPTIEKSAHWFKDRLSNSLRTATVKSRSSPAMDPVLRGAAVPKKEESQ
jgi:hypothetical protein